MAIQLRAAADLVAGTRAFHIQLTEVELAFKERKPR
jgi:hypothetical protein